MAMDDPDGAARLLGAWVTDPGDEDGLREYGRSTLEFAPGGQLTFTAHGDGRDQIALLDYRLEGDVLVMLSGASVAPESRATCRITRGGALELRYGDRRARYLRHSDQQAQRGAPTDGAPPATPEGAPPATPEARPARPWWRFW
jgi:hypothetical protein